MGTRLFLAVSAAAVVAVPALTLADGIAPHSSYYDEHAHQTKPVNDVSLVVHRDKGKADVFVQNFCLGSETFGSTKYPDSARALGVKVHHGKISFDGKGTISTKDGDKRVAERFAATVAKKKVTGTAKFPGTSCGTIAFKAPLVRRTK